VEAEPEVGVEEEVDPGLVIVPPVGGAEDGDVDVLPLEVIAGPRGAEKTKGSIFGGLGVCLDEI
jgi:hypothetical protein